MSFVAFGQKNVPKQNNNLQSAVTEYAAKAVVRLKNTGGMKFYAVKNQNIFYSDVDDDGDFDAVVEVFFCEKTSCHPTTQSSKLAIFINDKKKYKMTANTNFSLFGKINSVNKSKIRVDVYGLDGDDPQCFPTLKRSEVYEFKNNKLIKSK